MGEGHGRHVLIMDDEPAMLDVFEAALSEEGYRITTSRTVRDVADVRALHPDVIVLDLLFGGELAGLAFVEASRGDPDFTGIPILVCTAATGEPIERLASLGVTVLPKPFDLDDLLERVRALARRPNGQLDGQGDAVR
jgi:two-component system, OmpR family, response regulator